MASIQFVQTNNRYILKNCFDALRKHKENRKFKLLHHAVNEDMIPAIENLEQHNYAKSSDILTQSQYRASSIVRTMLGKRLFDYFRKWQTETTHYNVTMTTKVNHKLIQLFRGKIGSYFKNWKSKTFNKVI